MKLLIIGHKGQLGHDLMRLAVERGFDALGVDLPDCDVTSLESVRSVLNTAGDVRVVINAAAYTAVDAAEKNVDTAFAVNRDGASHIARACHEHGIPIIQVSTDYVFDGLKTTAYHPYDPVHPTSVYGAGKEAGEAAVRQLTDQHIIVRTAWLYGFYGHNFVKTMIRLARQRATLQVVDDQIGCPTYSLDLAGALLTAAAAADRREPVWGTYHYCNRGAVTWYAFARRIIALARSLEEDLVVQEILPVLSSQYSQEAQRPPCSILDCSSFENTFHVQRRTWTAALKEMVTELYKGQGNI